LVILQKKLLIWVLFYLYLGSKYVYSFEKYNEVIEIVKLNEKFSVNLNSKNLKLFNIDLKNNDIFEILSKSNLLFDSVIIDPPKMVILNY
jgi:predicted methyltransferase